MKEPKKEGEEEVPEPQEKGEQEEGRERSRRAAAVKATQTLQANEAVSDPHLHSPSRARKVELGLGMRVGVQSHTLVVLVVVVQEMDQILCALNLFGSQPCVVWAIMNPIL